MNLLKRHLLHPLLDLIFPKYCIGCDTVLHSGEEILCLSCHYRLPFTGLEHIKDNETDMRMYGKLSHLHAAPLLYFVEEGLTQSLMHHLKYGKRPEVGIFLGRLIAERYRDTDWFRSVDIIVPVPLHRKKQYRRGYNQATCIAQGIAEAGNMPLVEKALIRTVNTASQTNKSRLERLENVAEAFALNEPDLLKDKHILLVDDVLTTGATLAACGNVLLQVPGVRLSIASAALAIT